MPELPWNRLAAEMKANIRLGLAAGECVRMTDVPLRRSLFSGARAAVALAIVAALMVTGLLLEHPIPRRNFAQGMPYSAPGIPYSLPLDGVVVQSTGYGIEVGEGKQLLELRHLGAESVTYSVNAQGSIRARVVDPKTGYVTINNVYVEE
jgi:hypothetical protein